MLTDDQLRRIMPNATAGRRNAALPVLNSSAAAYEINNERRMSAWLATIAVESGELKYQEEIASGAAYEGRKDLGNTQKGDGRRFKGHGRIQITGRANHQSYTNYLKKSGHLPFVDFVAEPERLAQEPYATDSAAWFWAIYKKLNGPADKGDFLTTQIRVNGRNKRTGKPNHWDVRQNYYIKALTVLPDGFTVSATTSLQSDGTTPTAVANAKSTSATEPTESLPSDIQSEEPPTQAAPPSVPDNPTAITETQYQGAGLMPTLKKDFAAIGGGNISFQALQGYATEASGWPPWLIAIITKLATIAIVAGIIWLGFRLVHYGVWKITEWKKQKLQAEINTNPDLKDMKFVQGADAPTV